MSSHLKKLFPGAVNNYLVRGICKISSILKSNSEIGPLFKFFVKSVHFYCKISPLSSQSGPIL
jgi:hypothetical protein